MEKSTVYFTDFRCPVGTSQLDKLKKLCIAAGIKDIDMEGKFVAIKMHFGELGNMAFLRPNYAKVVLKNIGMGCGSRAGKMQQHASGKPAINTDVCRGCHRCAKECGSDAISYVDKKAVIDYDKCKGCGRCIGACSFDAVYNPNSSANELLDRKMAEYAQAVCHGRPCFHISLVQDISPNCDCHGENDAPILPDIGMFASFDPVALDQACADACLKTTPIENSQLGEHLAQPGWHCHHDHFKDSNPNIEWEATLDQAEKIGLGTRQYELKRIK